MVDEVPRPSATIEVESLDDPIVMNYVVFNDILRFVGGIEEAFASIMNSQETTDLIIRRLLTDNKKPIDSLEDLIGSEEVTLDIFDIDEVLAWVMEHVTYFFIAKADKVGKAMKKFPGMKEKMSSSLSESGTKDSTESKESVGPTE